MKLEPHKASKHLQRPPLPDDADHARPAPPGLPAIGRSNQHEFMYVVGGIGTGKTSFVLSWLTKHMKAGSFDYLFWCSPTGMRDSKVKRQLESYKRAEVMYSEDVPLDEIQDFIDGTLERYELTPEYRATWRRFLKSTDDPDKAPVLTERDIELLDKFNAEPPPKWPRGKPTFLLVCDDQLGSGLFSSRMSHGFNRFIVTMRHRRTSVLVSTQSVTQTIPPGLRAMVTSIALARVRDKDIQRRIAQTMAGAFSPDEFMEAWDLATRERFGWFFVSLLSPPGEQLRKNLDTLITSDDGADEADGADPNR